MRRFILLGFLLLLSLDTASQISMKVAADRIAAASGIDAWLASVVTEPVIALVILFNLASFLTYVTLLKQASVGPAYAVAHGHVVTVTLISVLFLGERMTWLQGLGALAIVAGILVLAATEQPEVPAAATDLDSRPGAPADQARAGAGP